MTHFHSICLGVGLVSTLLCATVPGWAAGASVFEATASQKKDASRVFRAATEDYERKRYTQALEGFRQSHGVVASPNSRLMIARTLRELERLPEAYLEFQDTVSDAKAAAEQDDKYAAAVQAAEAELTDLAHRVGLLRVVVLGAARDDAVTVGGEVVRRTERERPVPVVPGSVKVAATSADGVSVEREVSVAAGATLEVQLDLAPRKPAPARAVPAAPRRASDPGGGGVSPWPWVATGVGVAGLATFGVLGSMSQSRFDDLSAACPGGACRSDVTQQDVDRARLYQTVANVGLGVGVAGVLTGALLFVLGGGQQSGTEAALRQRRWSVAVGPRAVEVGGRF